MNLVIKMVNHIKTSAVNSRLFKVICEDIGSEYLSLLFHTDVRWLSRGNTAMRLFVLRKEILQFFPTTKHEYQKILEDEKFILYLAYQSGIFGVMNHFNRYLWGPESNIIDFAAKLTAFVRKLNLWIKKTSRTGSLECLRMWRHLERNQHYICSRNHQTSSVER